MSSERRILLIIHIKQNKPEENFYACKYLNIFASSSTTNVIYLHNIVSDNTALPSHYHGNLVPTTKIHMKNLSKY